MSAETRHELWYYTLEDLDIGRLLLLFALLKQRFSY